MKRTNNCLLILVSVVLAFSSSSLQVFNPVDAQSMTPAIPTFTVQYVVEPINMAPTSTINPYTGQNETAGASNSFMKKSIEVIITNQPFTSYPVKSDGITFYVNLYYDVRYKGHFSENWTDQGPGGYYIANTSSQNTTILLFTNNPAAYQEAMNNPSSGQIDVQVQSFIGYIYYGNVFSNGHLVGHNAYFNGTGSGWSNIQTITIPSSSASPTPFVPELSTLAIISLSTVLVAVAVTVKLKKRETKKLSC
jgi:hypothetical protein